MEKFVASQKALEHKINKSFENFKKKGVDKMTKGATQIQMQALGKRWEKFEQAHEEMLDSEDMDPKDLYFVNDKAELVHELYLDRLGEFQEHLNTFEVPRSSVRTLNISQPTQQNISAVSNSKLPNMPLPEFEGDYLQWSSFRNLFVAAISSQNLSDIEKITFLRGCVKGEPRDLIADQPVVEGNFDEIWKRLSDQYDNNRRVVTILIKKCFP